MRPLELELEGFTSFRARTTIALAELDLFAITGPTGAGKTSLLDALILALYGSTPRLGKEVSQLASRGLKHLRVRLDFAVQGQSYRVARSWRLMPKGVQTQAALEELGGRQAKSIAGGAGNVTAAVSEIIGLDFESFIRSVVLPQGEFDHFLKGEPKERQKILHHLLGMGIYRRVQELAQERAVIQERERRIIEIELGSLDGMTPATLDAGRDRLGRLEREALDLDRALAQASAIETMAAALTAELEKAAAARAETDRIAKALDVAGAKLKSVAAAEAEADRVRVELAGELESHPFDDNRHLALEKAESEIQLLRSSEAARERAAKESAGASARIAQIEGTLVAADQELERAGDRVSTFAKRLQNATGARDALAAEFGSAAQVAAHIGIEENRLKAERARIRLLESRTAALGDLERLELELTAARQEEALANAEREIAAAALESVQRAGAALALRQHLHRGAPCPVCEQPVASLPRKRRVPDLEQSRAGLDRVQARITESVKMTASLGARLTAGRERLAEIERDLEHLSEEGDSASAKLEGYLGALPDADTRARLTRAQSDFERAEKVAREATDKHRAIEAEMAEARARRDALANALESERKMLPLLARGREEAERAVGEKRNLLMAIVGEKDDLIAALEEAIQASRRARTARTAIIARIEAETDRLGDARKLAAETRAVLASLEVQRTEVDARVQGAAERAEDARARLTRAAGARGMTLPVTGDGEGERRVVAQRTSELQAARVRIEGDRVLAAKEVETIAGGIEKRAELDQRRSAVERSEKTARRLAEDLKTHNFVAYLVEEALAVLAADASRHLRTFPGAGFSLAVKEQDFLVIDHLNADERRSVKTLSGGECFNASLALAMAFAESLKELAGAGGRGRAALESLFIDEGFGTLDSENLDAVATAIESLYAHGRGRTVGIITHIPELAQRMPARIVIVKHGNASQVEVESG
jgi:exonuclease SbcC